MSTNEKIEIEKLDVKRFEALAGYTRSPAAAYVSQELAWFVNDDESILGTILLDTTDGSFATILLTRDETAKYRCFEAEASLDTYERAEQKLVSSMKWHTCQGLKMYPQGEGDPGVDLFSSVVSVGKQHPFFRHLASDLEYHPAKAIISEMMLHFVDIDGNFVQQFQSDGFDSRLWELYLNSYINEEELFLNRENNSPDFMVEKYAKKVAIEAVIVGRNVANPPKYIQTLEGRLPIKDVAEANLNEMPIRFGSPLYSKLKKKYWKLPHVQGLPIVFAIADFHDDQSMLWSSTGLINYLYGARHEHHYDEAGKLIITPVDIGTHAMGNKEIPSGFFSQPEAEHVSAVLFSASGTISKFNRMGRQAGYKADDVTMIRRGTCYNHDPNSATPLLFEYTVDESASETWAEGLSMYHNPNALNPTPRELFPSVAHHDFKDGVLTSYLPNFMPYSSQTICVRVMDDK